MANEKKELTQEELDAMIQKRAEELVAANADKAKTEDSGDGGKQSDDKGKKGIIDKVKDGANAFWNYSITPKKIVTGVAVGLGLFLGAKFAYSKGKADAEAEAEFNAPTLPDNGVEPLALETTAEPEIIEASVEDATEEVYEE